jgi:predicted SnoaL-like aldol condensation-catalyzing enzyme
VTTREVIERYIAAYVSGDTSALADIIAPGFVDHTFPAFSGMDGVARAIATIHAIGDVTCTLEQCVCDGDTAAFRVIARAGDVEWTIADFVRLAGGKLVELWSVQTRQGPPATGRRAP